MLELQNITKKFNGKVVLDQVSLNVAEGVTHALIGSSGSGKTTLLRVTLGLIPFDSGYVKIENQPLLSFTPTEWAERIGYVPQEGGLFPHLTARKNISIMADLRRWEESKVRTRVEELAQLTDLAPALLDRFPHELSGGQRQRVAIVRAAFLNPPVMLLDEPMGALDPLIRATLQTELKSIFKRLGKTVLLVTHDLSEAAFLAEEITLLHGGQVVQSGSYRELALNPATSFVTQFINAQRGLPVPAELT